MEKERAQKHVRGYNSIPIKIKGVQPWCTFNDVFVEWLAENLHNPGIGDYRCLGCGSHQRPNLKCHRCKRVAPSRRTKMHPKDGICQSCGFVIFHSGDKMCVNKKCAMRARKQWEAFRVRMQDNEELADGQGVEIVITVNGVAAPP